jgi:hypothetical protein
VREISLNDLHILLGGNNLHKKSGRKSDIDLIE